MQSDIQADTLDMDESYASRVLRGTVTNYNNEHRNLNNEDLSIFYPAADKVSNDQLATDYDAIVTFRDENSLNPVTLNSFINQKNSGDQSLFKAVLASAGIEEVAEDDVITDSGFDRLPSEGDKAAFIYSLSVLGIPIATPSVLETLKNDPVLAEQVYVAPRTHHFVESEPYEIADEDNQVAQNIDQIKECIRRLTQ